MIKYCCHGLFLCFLFTCSLFAQDIHWLTPKIINLGRVQQGTVLEDTIAFVNTGQRMLTIDKIQSSCGCTVAKIEKKEIAPNDTGYIGFTLKTRGFRGMVRKSLRITFNEYPEYTKLILLQVYGFTNIDFEPSFLFLNNAVFDPDSIYQLRFQVRNNSDHAIHLQHIYTQDSCLVVFPETMFLSAEKGDSIHIEFRPRDITQMYFPIMFETDDPVQKSITYRFHVRFKDAY